MPRVLVVDDSSVSRSLAAKILEQGEDLTVVTADSGAQALAAIERDPPDAVVTDLIMPGMDGLQLLESIRTEHPLLPVVIVSAKGTQEIAVQALQQGAASYVTKRSLPRMLLETVESVIAGAAQARGRARLMQGMVASTSVFVLENDRALFRPLVHYLQGICASLELCGTEEVRLGVALEEALANAMEHGNLELDSRLREDDVAAYCAAVEERSAQRPYKDRRIHVEARITRSAGVFVVRDEGPGFDWRRLPKTVQAEDLESVSGRGVLLMRMFMDELSFNEAGNEVTLVKRRVASAVS